MKFAADSQSRIVPSDIESAQGQSTLWRKPSDQAMRVYDELVRHEESSSSPRTGVIQYALSHEKA